MPTETLPPGTDIQAAIDANPAPTVFQLSAGVYRAQHFVARSGDQFIGDPGGGTILSGALVLRHWVAAGNLWKAGGLPAPLVGHGDAGGHALALAREDLFVDNTLYQRVGSLSEVGPGTWYFDAHTRAAYVADNPDGHTVEYSTAPSLTFDNGATGVVVRHLTIEKYATDAQTGPIHGVRGWHIIDVTSRFNHGAGLNIGAGTVVQGGHYVHNGQIGINGWHADGAQVLGAEIAHNNYAGYSVDWEAGGMKISGSANVLVSGNDVHDNRGMGLWSDIDDRNFTYSHNTVVHNAGNGIMYEISYGSTLISDNVVTCNRGAQIYISNSQGVEVSGNSVTVGAGNKGIAGGISMIYVDRGSGSHGPYLTRNNSVHDNVIKLFGGGGNGIWIYQGPEAASVRDNHWDNNSYMVSDGALPHWHFGQTDYRWDELVKSTGFEQHGTMVVLAGQQAEDPCQLGQSGLSGGMVIDTALLMGLASLALRHR